LWKGSAYFTREKRSQRQTWRRFLGITYQEDLGELFEEKDLRTAKQKFEKLFIQKKLREYNGDVKKVAEVIGIDLSNLYRKLKLYGIEV